MSTGVSPLVWALREIDRADVMRFAFAVGRSARQRYCDL